MSRAAVAVLGTPYRGDDGVGPLVGERLRDAGVVVLDCGDEPTRLIEPFAGLDLAVLVDAVSSGADPGTVHVVEVAETGLPRELRPASSHAVGVADALELARALGRAPARVVLVGIEGRAFAMGDPMTPAVGRAVGPAVAAVLAAIGEA